MAVISFYRGFDMRFFADSGTVFGDAIRSGTPYVTSANYWFIDEGDLGEDQFAGVGFAQPSDNMPTVGTFWQWDYVLSTEQIWSFTGFEVDASVFSTLLLADDVDTLLAGYVMAGADEVHGSDESDYLLGYGGDDWIYGNDGNDVLVGGIGADTMFGNNGNDNFHVDNGGDQAVETSTGGGVDAVASSVSFTLGNFVENLTLTGGAAINGTGNTLNNVLIGNAAANTLNGGDGNDTLNGGTGADTMVGGAGDDSFYVDNAGDQVNEAAAAGTDRVVSSITITLDANVENLTLTGGAAISGTGNTLNNVIIGNAAANTLNGGDGNDTLIGGTGADALYGGNGADVYYADDAGDRAYESAVAGIDRVISSVTFLLGVNVEDLTLTGTSAINGFGNSQNNVMFGNSGNNVLNGSTGADTMNGGAGDDIYYVDNIGDRAMESSAAGGVDRVNSSVTFALGNFVDNLTLTGALAVNGFGNSQNNGIVGNTGNNILNGGAGNDILNGGAGADQLYGSAGNDSLTGGTGADRFIFYAALDAATNVDGITDFSVVDDTIALDQTIFAALPASGVLAAAAFRAGTAAGDADDRIIYDATTGRIYYDADGNGAGAQVLFATVAAGTALTNADFLMVP